MSARASARGRRVRRSTAVSASASGLSAAAAAAAAAAAVEEAAGAAAADEAAAALSRDDGLGVDPRTSTARRAVPLRADDIRRLTRLCLLCVRRGPTPGQSGQRPARRRGRIQRKQLATVAVTGGARCARPSVRGTAASGTGGYILGAARAATAARARRCRRCGDDRPHEAPASAS
eukprot:7376025-Prymnesium_polylepis.1